MRPDDPDITGRYVRAVYAFDTDHPREISLAKGDIIKIISVVDDNWYTGSHRDKEGNFPASFVENLVLPAVQEGQKLFGAVESFPALEDGDLEFRKGAVILGTRQIDSNWWEGQIGSHTGIFPVTHVMELDQPSILKERSKSVHSSEPLFAIALCDSVAQLDEELGFKTGDMITVTEVIDSDWFYGELGNKQGMFLASCVELIQDDSNSSEKIQHQSSETKSSKLLQKSYSFDQSYYGNLKDKDLPAKDHKKSEAVNLPKQNSVSDAVIGVVPSVDADFDHNSSYTSQNARVTPYALSLFPFEGQSEDELSFDANEIIYLLHHIDDQWMEGSIDGRTGLFPTCFVSIIVDCGTEDQVVEVPDKSRQQSQSFESACNKGDSITTNNATENFPPGPLDNGTPKNKYALVLYSFMSPYDGELSVNEGDTVIVLRSIDSEWVEVEDDSGKTGIVPVQFLDIIGDSPDHSPKPIVESSSNNNQSSITNFPVPLNIPKDIPEKDFSPKSESIENIQKECRTFPSDSDGDFDRNSLADKFQSKQDKFEDSMNHDNIPSTQSLEVSHKSSPQKGKENKKTPSHIAANINFTLEQKPVLPVKVKPQLAPKPVLKPKPSLLPKPNLNTKGKLLPMKAMNSLTINKSNTQLLKCSSTQDFKSMEDQSSIHSDMQKSLSSSELSSISTDRGDRETQQIDMQSTQDKFSFKNVDTSKSLNAIISDELTKAKEDMKMSRSESLAEKRINGQSNIDNVTLRKSEISSSNPQRHSVNFPLPEMPLAKTSSGDRSSVQVLKNESSDVFSYSSDFKGKYSTGNSVFFVDPVSPKSPTMRKPPPIPQRSFEQDSWFDRKPSLRKAPPPRPIGPRLASAPPNVPLVPLKIQTEKGFNDDALARKRPARPAPSRPAPTRPAPSRPVPLKPLSPRASTGMPAPKRPPPRSQDIVPDVNVYTEAENNKQVEVDPEVIADLKKKIQDLQTDIDNCTMQKNELEIQKEKEEGNMEEITENIQFYTENISGMTTELQSLKKNLMEMSPEENDIIARQEAEKQRKLEEEKQREEEIKKAKEMREKRREKREKVIEELFQTEKDFLQSLSLCIETFLSPETEKHPDIEMGMLMGNIEDVADISQRLLTAIENAVQGKDFSQQVIGVCFVFLSEDMKNAFAPYCRNHDEVITLLEKYHDNQSVREYFERLLNKLRKKMVIFDLEALLIKPVQRILKYPLLLNELFKTTEDDHPDKAEILKAINAMTDVASAINEYKRRKDLVYKYKKVSDETLGDKLAKLSFHTIRKKGSRFKGRLSTNLGLSPQTKDENFDREEARFHQLEKIVKIFVKDVQNFMDQLQESVTCHECLVADLVDFYDDKQSNPEIQKYQLAQETLEKEYLPQFQESVRDFVTIPLGNLMQMFEAPNKVIQKRFDKLLDYDSMLKKVKDEKMSEKSLQTVKNDYEALNAQLMDELPKMYTLSLQLLQDCIGAFVQARREFVSQRCMQLSETLDLPSLLSASDNLIEIFNIHHVAVVDKLSLLSFIPKGFNPKMDAIKQADKKAKRHSVDVSKMPVEESPNAQAQSQKVFLQQKYPPDKLYRVVQNYAANDLMDLVVSAGDLVGVIQEKDPMGNKDRWFVDNGANKGFVPSHLLQLHQSSPAANTQKADSNQLYPAISQSLPSSPLSPIPIGQNQTSFTPPSGQMSPNINQTSPRPCSQSDNLAFEMDEFLEEDMTPEILEPESQSFECEEFYYAEYSFQSRNANEVSLFEGQVVTVYAKHDEQGNTEWWYVDADGVRGYTPAAYLQPMS